MEYIIALGAFQALIALSLFIGNRKRKPADNLLNWLLICLFSHLTIKFIIYAVSGNAAIQNAFNTFIDLAYGPLLWMYTNKVLNDRYKPQQYWYLLMPTVAAGAVFFTIAVKMILHPENAMSLLAYYNSVTNYLIIASCIIYPVMVLMLSHRMPAFWRSEQQLIRRIAICFLVVPAIWLITNIIQPFHLLNAFNLNIVIRIIAYSNLLIVSLFIIRYRMAANAINNETVEENNVPAAPDMPAPVMLVQEKENLTVAVQPNPLSRKTVLSDGQQAAIANRLALLMEEKKVYTDPDLTLEKLASLMKTPRHHVSEVLNQYMHRSFYQFINDFRMQKVLMLLDQCRRQEITPNILSIAYEAGFNSKSAFNQYFKKTTGFTPTEYLKRSEDAPLPVSPPLITFT
ncbi:MAG TPA: helix-turn-helix transcriptional regulator [Niastella sp.]